MLSKYQKALNNIKKEAGTPYFSSSYDIDDWKEDFKTLQELVDKESKYQDLEEELGISLPILLKAKKVYFKFFLEDEIKESYRVHFDITRNILIVYEYPEDEFGNGFSLKEYGKNWALCKEDLKSE